MGEGREIAIGSREFGRLQKIRLQARISGKCARFRV